MDRPIRMLRIKEAASMLGVGLRTMERYVAAGDVRSVRVRGARRGSPVLIPEPAIISLCGTARYLR